MLSGTPYSVEVTQFIYTEYLVPGPLSGLLFDLVTS
jgi:hypothetical protein